MGVVVAVVALSACGSSSKSTSSGKSAAGGTGSSPAGAPGVSGAGVKVGIIDVLSGQNADPNDAYLKGAEARFKQQNADGGVDGRQISWSIADDAGSGPQAISAAKVLVQSKGVFGILALDSEAISQAAPYLLQNHVPVTGPNTGTVFGTMPYTNFFGTTGSEDPKAPTATTIGNFLKSQGGTSLATAALSVAPSSVGYAKDQAESAKAVGLKVGYANYSIAFTGENYTADGLAMAKSGADVYVPGMTPQADIALLQAAVNAGAKIKATVLGDFSPLELQGGGAQALNGAYFPTPLAPPVMPTSATKSYLAAVEKYAGITSAQNGSDFSLEEGYVSADLFITGLLAAGKNPTRESFITNLRKDTHYTAGGLEASPVSYDLSQFGRGVPGYGPNACQYFMHLVNGELTVQGQQPLCGTVVPNSDTL